MKVSTVKRYAPKFQPIVLTITIESLEELRSLTARVDLAPSKILPAMDSPAPYGGADVDVVRLADLYHELMSLYQEVKK